MLEKWLVQSNISELEHNTMERSKLDHVVEGQYELPTCNVSLYALLQH